MNAREPAPAVDVIVAVHNEAALIEGKLVELAAMQYPAHRLRFIVVDGGSSDGTIGIISRYAANDVRVMPVFAGRAGKIAQLNLALESVRAPWVLVTDADARLPPDTLARLIDVAQRRSHIGVVGTTVQPHRPHPLDRCHWLASNWLRRFEAHWRGTTGLVAAPCYLFRRGLIDRFADDVIADDVHVVHRAAMRGAGVALIDSPVVELRVAATLGGWYRHKVRRTLAYLREVLRFGQAIRDVAAPMRSVLLWRALALTAGPVAGIGALAWLALNVGITATLLTLGLLAAVSGRVVTGEAPRRLWPVAVGSPVWVLLVSVTALVLYPFVRQSASYSRASLATPESEVCP